MRRLCCVLALFTILASSQEPTGARIANAAKEPQNWLTYFGTYNGWRYSPLDQINLKNVKSLAPAWAFQTGKIEGGLNATPLEMDGVLYLVGSYDRVFALNAVTGEQLWHYFYKLPQAGIPYGVSVRGMALGYGLVFLGTLDNHMVAIDAKTGKEVWDIEIEDSKVCGCNITAAPLLINDKVVVGVTGGDSAHRGYLTAFDAKSGKQAWRFYTIPGAGEPGSETWAGDSWKFGGGATWMIGTFDPSTNTLFWGIGNPSSDFYGGDRGGDNLYTDSIVALDADTGKIKWHYQEVPHDTFDFDAAYEPVLFDQMIDGKMRQLIVHPNKGGYTWVLDRTTGKFVNAWPHVDAVNWLKGIDKDGKLIGRMELKPGENNFVCPDWGGGRSWNHSSYSPRTGLWYNHGIEWCSNVRPAKQPASEGKTYVGGSTVPLPPPGGGPATAHLDAYDPVSGKKMWTWKTKYPILSSILTTGGDLLFVGDVEGKFIAFNAKSGEQVWSFNTGSGHRGSAITYSVNGRQYIAVPSGLGSIFVGGMAQMWPETRNLQPGSTLFVFALPEGTK